MTCQGDFLLPDAALSLSEEQRRKIACTLVMVAAADGALVREEISAIESAMGLMMLHPESREEVRQLLTQPPDLDSVLDGMEISFKWRMKAQLHTELRCALVRTVEEARCILKRGCTRHMARI